LRRLQDHRGELHIESSESESDEDFYSNRFNAPWTPLDGSGFSEESNEDLVDLVDDYDDEDSIDSSIENTLGINEGMNSGGFGMGLMGSASGHGSRILESDPEIIVGQDGRREINLRSESDIIPYDSDWSELQDLIYVKDDDESNEEVSNNSDEEDERVLRKRFLFNVLAEHGSLATVIISKAISKESHGLLNDPLFKNISLDFNLSAFSVYAEINNFLKEVLHKVKDSLQVLQD